MAAHRCCVASSRRAARGGREVRGSSRGRREPGLMTWVQAHPLGGAPKRGGERGSRERGCRELRTAFMVVCWAKEGMETGPGIALLRGGAGSPRAARRGKCHTPSNHPLPNRCSRAEAGGLGLLLLHWDPAQVDHGPRRGPRAPRAAPVARRRRRRDRRPPPASRCSRTRKTTPPILPPTLYSLHKSSRESPRWSRGACDDLGGGEDGEIF